MKKYFLLFLALLNSVVFAKESFFKYVEFDSKANFNLREQDSTYSAKALSKVFLKGFDLRLSESTKTLSFEENVSFNKIQFSAIADFYSLFKIPLGIKIGTLSLSGAVSKLNSPNLSSSVSAFSNSVGVVGGVLVNPIGLSSSQKDLSFSVYSNFYIKEKSSPVKSVKIVAFCDKDFKIASGSSVNFNLGSRKSLLFSTNFQLSSIKNTDSAWFSKRKLFPESKIFSGNFETVFYSRFLDFAFCTNIYENAFGKPDFCFSLQNKIKIYNFSLGLQGFFTSTDELTTSSGKKLTTIQQIKASPELKILLNNKALLNLGSAVLIENKRNSIFEDLNIYGKSTFGAELKTLKSSVKFSFSSSNLNFNDFSEEVFSQVEHNFLLKSYFYKFYSSNLALNFVYSPQTEVQEFSSKASVYFCGSFFKDKSLKCSSKITLSSDSQKIESLKPEFSIYYKKKIKGFCLNLSCGVNYTVKI